MTDAAFPYDCAECQLQPAASFAIYTEANDWLQAYPEQQLVHIHYGHSTHEELTNIQEAEFVCAYLMKLTEAYPDKRFFIMVDFTHGDDSEFVPPESMKLYRSVLKHPQLRQGVVYGGTFALHYLVELLFRISGNNIKIVSDKAEADQEYQRWLQRQRKS